ncbi:MAG: hypothetical protein ACM3QW_04870 [Ignavibacteriales bacterium]
MAVVYVIAVLGLGAVEGRPLIKEKRWFELIVFSVLLAAGLIIIVMDTVSYSPWRLSRILSVIFEPLSSFVKFWLLKFLA